MTVARQSLIVSRLTLAGLRTRLWPSLVIVLSMAGVVGVLLSMLSLTSGLIRAFGAAGDPAQAIVLSSRVPFENSCEIERNIIGTILDAPGIARGTDGGVLADAESVVVAPTPDGMTGFGILLRGVGSAGTSLKPAFRMVEGRMFRSGRQEVIAGVGLQRSGLNVGDTVSQPDGEWPIVGLFAADGGPLEHDLLGDAATVMASHRRTCFSTVRVKLQSAAVFGSFRQWLTGNPTLAVEAERLSDYYAHRAAQDSSIFAALAFLVGAVMGVGALFGTLKIMYAAVSARTREIATLRAIGYQPFSVAFSVVLEAVVLSLAGAALGGGLAWMLFDGQMAKYWGHDTYALAVGPPQLALGFAWATAIALLGSLAPAVRAARLTVAEALRPG
jgi:putative ABC transport system permease protein